MKELLDALTKISNYCSSQVCTQCPFLRKDSGEHPCELRNYIPENWKYLVDRLRDKGEQ